MQGKQLREPCSLKPSHLERSPHTLSASLQWKLREVTHGLGAADQEVPEKLFCIVRCVASGGRPNVGGDEPGLGQVGSDRLESGLPRRRVGVGQRQARADNSRRVLQREVQGQNLWLEQRLERKKCTVIEQVEGGVRVCMVRREPPREPHLGTRKSYDSVGDHACRRLLLPVFWNGARCACQPFAASRATPPYAHCEAGQVIHPSVILKGETFVIVVHACARDGGGSRP